MKTFILALLLAVAKATTPAIDLNMVREINAGNHGWEAHESPRFKDQTLAHVQRLCGSIVDPDVVIPLPEKTDFLLGANIPTDFDARTQWPGCPSITHVRDQADCGSCWAFGSTEAFNDRLCIASGQKFTTLLSPEDTVSCCGFLQCFSMGCNGGQPNMAWNWFTKTGVVSGGNYADIGKGDTCMPYELPNCAHHVDSKKYPACGAKEDPTPACKKTCSESNYGVDFNTDKHKADSAYSISGVSNIQQEIMTNGPVTGTLTVYADFPTYKSGVYKHVSGSALGGHAIKILGWGVENGADYWLVANSWNEEWGNGGFFKIARGNDECGIESGVSAGKVSYKQGLRAQPAGSVATFSRF